MSRGSKVSREHCTHAARAAFLDLGERQVAIPFNCFKNS